MEDKPKIDHKQCRVCFFRLRLAGAENQTGCDLLGMTGICRITNKPLALPNGLCKYFTQDQSMPPLRMKGVDIESTFDKSEISKFMPTPVLKNKTRAKKKVVQIDRDGNILAVFSGAQQAADKTGTRKETVYGSCNWRAMKRTETFRGCGKKGYTFRYTTDPDIAEQYEAYEKAKGKTI